MKSLLIKFILIVFLVVSANAATTTLNTGQTLILNHNSSHLDGDNLSLNGGTLDLTGNDYQQFGKMTLMKDSQITFENIAFFDLYFRNSQSINWSGILTINGWTGDNVSGGAVNHIYFSSENSLNNRQLAQISFSGFGKGAILLTSGELVPMAIPEIRACFAGIIIFLIVLYKETRNFNRHKKDSPV